MNIPFNNTYINLPEGFYTKLKPTNVQQPSLIKFNHKLAETLGITEFDSDEKLAGYFSGNTLLEGSEPLAMVYAGHQFGRFSPQLGDGRAILLGEIIAKDGVRYDLQLKGSGRTPYSRGGDGRSALGPVIREYIISEAMAKLGIPTTRALAAVTSGEEVARMTLVPGGILTRVAKGFVRVGTFEFFSARHDINAVKALADHEIERHYPAVKESDNPYASFLAEVVNAQAKLIAQWMGLGFIHGVMNTDNMSIAGETIDYGPCALMDDFAHERVFSSIDHGARYAYSNQAKIGQWNLVRLAETLLPLFVKSDEVDKATQEEINEAVKIAQDILNDFQTQYKQNWLAIFRQKIGLQKSHEQDTKLINDLLDCMEEGSADFSLTFYSLSQLSNQTTENDKAFCELFNNKQNDNIKHWLSAWRQRLLEESSIDTDRCKQMQSINPVYIPRNHQVEAAIRAAEDHNDFSVFDALNEVLQNPYQLQQGKEHYQLAPSPEERVKQTFCGT